jgi:hypothetical protein
MTRRAAPIALALTLLACLGLPLAVWAQAVPEAAAVAPVAADPLTSILTSLGPTGGAGAIVAYVLHSWRTEAARHAAERDDLRARLSALELAAAVAAERHQALLAAIAAVRQAVGA